MHPQPSSRAPLATLIACILTLLPACATHKPYGDRAVPQSERSVIEGYFRYLLLYFEELQIASVDGQPVGGLWADASSVSVPAGRHWVQFVVLRNNRSIASCAFEGAFEARHHYKLQHLERGQALLAHPTSPRYPAAIAMNVVAPSGEVRAVSARAECGEGPHCRTASDCPANRSCRMDAGFEFGTCEPERGRSR